MTTTPKTTNQSTLNDHFKKATGTTALEKDNNFEYEANTSIYNEFTSVPAKRNKPKITSTSDFTAIATTKSVITTANQFESLSDSDDDEDWIYPNLEPIITSPPTNCDPASILPHTILYQPPTSMLEQHVARSTRSHKNSSKKYTATYLDKLHKANEANDK